MRLHKLGLLLAISIVFAVGCAVPAPTATPTTAPIAAPTPTKAPTATPTKRPAVKAEMAAPNVFELTRAPVQVAIQKGFFREEGLDIDLVATGSGANALAAALG
ncbi:MAG: ABC transporter substrate-binding protein, partial [Chloroflexi bacterium]|nr:ABC transporter substrate-binding protein [Chloroflexota bacterium]